MAKKYRIAIVGCGGISHAHGNAWRHLPEIEIVGACDEKLESLKRFATEFNVQNTYNDLRQMLEKTAARCLSRCYLALKPSQKRVGGGAVRGQRHTR